MIQPIDKIPCSEKRGSKRDEIRADIAEAIEKGINKFEFTGDYNYKYLAQYVKEEADRLISRKISDAVRKYSKTVLQPNETKENGFYWFPDTYTLRHTHKYITIFSCKAEPHRRVFCQIDFSTFDDDVKNLVDREIEEVRNGYEWNGKKWERKVNR